MQSPKSAQGFSRDYTKNILNTTIWSAYDYQQIRHFEYVMRSLYMFSKICSCTWRHEKNRAKFHTFNIFWIKDRNYLREPRVGGNALALELPSWLPAASILGCLSLESCILVACSVFTRCSTLNLTPLVLRLPSPIDPKASALGGAPYHKLFDFCNCYLYKMLLHNHLPNSPDAHKIICQRQFFPCEPLT